MVFSGFQLIPQGKTCVLSNTEYCSGSDKASMSPKRILNVDLSYLPNCTEFLHRF